MSQTSPKFPAPNGLRTLKLLQFAPRSARGVLLPQGKMHWPEKSSAETLDYCLDCTEWLIDANDALAEFAATILPNGGQYDMAVVWSIRDEGRILLGMSGGVPRIGYSVLLTGTTEAGRKLVAKIGLLINTDTPQTAPDAPREPPGMMVTEGGTPVSTEGGNVGVADVPNP